MADFGANERVRDLVTDGVLDVRQIVQPDQFFAERDRMSAVIAATKSPFGSIESKVPVVQTKSVKKRPRQGFCLR